jgi:hypothetical protein
VSSPPWVTAVRFIPTPLAPRALIINLSPPVLRPTADLMPFFNDYDRFEVDIYMILALFLILGGDSTKGSANDDANFIFTSLSHNPSRVAPFVTSIIRDALAEINPAYASVFEHYSGTSLRVGAATHILDHPMCSMWHAIVRGGWSFENLCRMFEYAMGCITTMAIAGRALSNWPYPHLGVVPPRCVFLDNCDEDTQTKANNFKVALFNSRYSTAAYQTHRRGSLVELFMSLTMFSRL